MVSWQHLVRSAYKRKTGGLPARPTMIANFAVTFRCNSRCRTCNIWRIGDSARDEVSLAEIRDIFELNGEFLRDVRSIQVTGGEPFLRDDLPDIVSVIHEHLPRCTFWIPTNGMNPIRIASATKEILGALDHNGLGVSVSLDGMEQTHDTIRGVEGSFRRAIETLRRLSSLRSSHPGLKLSAGMTVTPENHGEMGEVYDLARRHGAEFSFRPENFSDLYYRNFGRNPIPVAVANKVLDVSRRVGRDLVERHGLWASLPTLRYMQGAVNYIRNPANRRLLCSAGSDSLFLDPYGNVHPCIFLDIRMGNLRETPMAEIWASAEATETRRRVRDGRCPGCWVECETFRNVLKDRRGLAFTALRALVHPSTSGIS